jgi:hypothetical protein
MAPWFSSMVHNVSIYYSCASNGLLCKDLCALEVNWCQNFTLIVLALTFSYELSFASEIAHWKYISKLFYLRCRDMVYIHLVLVKMDCLKMLFRASKLPYKFKTFKILKISYKIDCLLL